MDSFYSDGSDDSDVYGATTQFQGAGYNSYGRPSMTHSNSLQQQESSEDDGDGSCSSSDGDSHSDEEPAAAASPVQPRGKTFRPPVGEGDSSSSSEDEGYNAKPSDTTAQVVNPHPGPPRGKELRLMMKGNDSSTSSDDEPLAKKKTKKTTQATGSTATKTKSKAKSNGAARKKSAPAPKKAATKAPAKKTTPKKRKAPPIAKDSDSGSDDEDPVAAVVCEESDDDDVVLAVAENIQCSSKRSKANDGSAKRRAAPKKGSGAAKRGGGGKGKTGSNKGSSASSASRKSAASAVFGVPEVSAEKAAAACKARHALQEAVPSLPHAVSETHTVRSFGRIKPEWHSVASPLDALYSSPHAIYPVGFSCDRLEFSPVHGRVIKLRCDILDGGALREQREEEEKKEKERARLKSEEGGEPMLVDEKAMGARNGVGDDEGLGDGPVFRVTWGEGVEEDRSDPSCPFDPYIASAQLGGDVDAIAVPLSSKKGKPAGLPEVGMRVSVRFDKAKIYGGVIADVKPVDKKVKNKKATCNITIQYDDGASEVAAFPDPDINVAYQGA